ncbi:hypothetical protein CTAYLR_006872 [Chrysophaeum taylorii]|uniref:Uncharacterized protein n=1 Tax=Chrysophaeum taylorii TaxID=2483200 RepID=A0AAD7U608_9STRA|nr:hypothetical protein CTAYLR_006872 [Chrysophaeum taylorii]
MLLLFVALVANRAAALVVMSAGPVSRRKAIGAAISWSTSVAGSAARAASGDDGSLPDGPLQGDDDIDAKEWEAVGLFLRKLYDEGDDMIFLARNLDSGKKGQAKNLADAFRTSVKKADRPSRDHDRTAFLAAYDDTARFMDTFLELLHDVPDEL